MPTSCWSWRTALVGTRIHPHCTCRWFERRRVCRSFENRFLGISSEQFYMDCQTARGVCCGRASSANSIRKTRARKCCAHPTNFGRSLTEQDPYVTTWCAPPSSDGSGVWRHAITAPVHSMKPSPCPPSFLRALPATRSSSSGPETDICNVSILGAALTRWKV